MAKIAQNVIDDVLYQLGDASQQVWSQDEIFSYVQDAYDRLAQTGIFWDVTYLEDQPMRGNVTCPEEIAYLDGGDAFTGLLSYTSPIDAEYVDPGELNYGPCNHTSVVDDSYVDESYYQAVHDLPEGLLDIERSTWNSLRIEPLRPSELEAPDYRYRINNGEVRGFLRDQDGLMTFRKWRIPSVAADSYTVTGTFGGLKSVSGPSTVLGTRGVCRRIPGIHPCSGNRGTPRRLWKYGHNTKIEFTRLGKELTRTSDELECPDRYAKYLGHFAKAGALEREGPGQDLSLSQFWKGLWDAGIARTNERKNRVNHKKTYRMADSPRMQNPPLARLPWNYGRVVS